MSGQPPITDLDAFQARMRKDSAFIGQPKVLARLAASEFWERFAYYGMQSLLVLYLTHQLLQPGHVQKVWGLVVFRRLVEFVYDRPSTAALASNIAQLYAALVFLTPLAGSFIADRFFGRTRTVTAGALIMIGGSSLLAVDATFLVGLMLLLVGVGCFKGNIASQVGDLYSIDDPRRGDGFQVYFLAIQLAVIVSPIVCGTLGQKVDWHLGFIAAGVGMSVGLAIYRLSRANYPPEPVQWSDARTHRRSLSARDWRVVILLFALLPVLALSMVGNQEMFNAYLLWAEKNYRLVIFGRAMPVTWIVSLEAFISTGAMLANIKFWRWIAKRWKQPDEITKIAVSVAIGTLAPLVLAAASATVEATGHPVSLAWAIVFHIVNDFSLCSVVPLGVALYSRASPKGLHGTMIAVYYLSLFMSTLLVGYLGGLLGTMSNARFWALHSELMALSLLLLAAARIVFGRLLAPRSCLPTDGPGASSYRHSSQRPPPSMRFEAPIGKKRLPHA